MCMDKLQLPLILQQTSITGVSFNIPLWLARICNDQLASRYKVNKVSYS